MSIADILLLVFLCGLALVCAIADRRRRKAFEEFLRRREEVERDARKQS